MTRASRQIRCFERWRRPVLSHESLAAFEDASTLPDGIHAVDLGGAYLDMLLESADSDALLVFFNGAVQRTPELTLPVFSGLQVSAGLSCSRLLVSDPTLCLHPELGLAWYSGSRWLHVQTLLPRALRKVVATLGVKRTLLYGTSGGGFASLLYGRSLDNALSIAVNPQTSIGRYVQRFVRSYAETCFGCPPEGAPEEAFAPHIQHDLCVTFRTGPRPPVLYLQNRLDWHVRAHVKPFLVNFGVEWTGEDLRAPGLYVHSGRWGEGHRAPPVALVAHLLREATRWAHGWHEALAELDLARSWLCDPGSGGPSGVA